VTINSVDNGGRGVAAGTMKVVAHLSHRGGRTG
jgi:hypothetical protein